METIELNEAIRLFIQIGSGSGNGSGDGSGDGAGYGDGDGDGYGYGYGSGIKAIITQGHIYYGYLIDNVYTFVESVDLQRRILAGFTLDSDLTTTKCVVVKEGNTFAHGKDLHEAYEALREKMYDDSTEDERLNAFTEHFPEFEGKYPNTELFIWHHILTGSCLFGRKEFAKSRSIDLDDTMSIAEFITLTENAYNGRIIRRLKEKY